MYNTIIYNKHYNLSLSRSTPVESLHTILLGPYKYFLAELMDKLEPNEKRKIEAKLASFPQSGLPYQIPPEAVCKYYKSFVGRDFKVLAQMLLFVVWDHLTTSEQEVWKSLSKV